MSIISTVVLVCRSLELAPAAEAVLAIDGFVEPRRICAGDNASDFFLSVALMGVESGDSSQPEIGTIIINGVACTGDDFVWGIPPPNTVSPSDDLAGHGIYNPDGA